MKNIFYIAPPGRPPASFHALPLYVCLLSQVTNICANYTRSTYFEVYVAVKYKTWYFFMNRRRGVATVLGGTFSVGLGRV